MQLFIIYFLDIDLVEKFPSMCALLTHCSRKYYPRNKLLINASEEAQNVRKIRRSFLNVLSYLIKFSVKNWQFQLFIQQLYKFISKDPFVLCSVKSITDFHPFVDL